jgi:pentatricopeptide repeat protein
MSSNDADQQLIKFTRNNDLCSVEKHLQQLYYSHPDTGLQMETFVIVATHISKCNDNPLMPLLAESVLTWCLKFFQAQRLVGDLSILVFNLTIRSWQRSHHAESGTWAEQILDQMETEFDKSKLPFPPNHITYNSVLACYRDNQNYDRVRSVFDRMVRAHLSGNLTARPTWATLKMMEKANKYNEQIHRHCQAGEIERAQEVLRTMYQDFQNGNMNARPNTHSFTSMLMYWTKLGQPTKAEELLDNMHQVHKKGILAMKPHKVAYHIVMNGYAEAGMWQKAEQYLDMIQREFQDESDQMMRLGRSEYCTLMKAYAKSSGLDNAGEKADLLMAKAEKDHPALVDDASVLALLKKVWTKNSNNPRAEERLAELNEMIAKRGRAKKTKSGARGKPQPSPSSPEDADDLLDWKNVLETVNQV